MSKTVMLVGNCQAAALWIFLNKSAAFRETFTNCHVILNYKLVQGQAELPTDDAFRQVDLYIYQPVYRDENRAAVDRLLDKLSPQCQKIRVPFLLNTALWPAMEHGLTIVNSAPVDRLIEQGATLSDVVAQFRAGTIDFEYGRRWTEALAELRRREQDTEVRVADFIESQVSKKKLFLTQSHPTSAVFQHMADQILPMLGMSALAPQSWSTDNDAQLPFELPYSKCAIKHYALQYCVTNPCWADEYYEELLRKMYQRKTA